VDEAFEQYIVSFEKKYAPLAEAQKQAFKEQDPERDPIKQRTPIKGQMAGWLACFRAMRSWPAIAPGDICCPATLVVGTKNENAMRWVDAHRGELEQAGVELQIIDGLTHPEEFTEIDRVFPVVSQFFKEHIHSLGEQNVKR
jgi:hypothetical protein